MACTPSNRHDLRQFIREVHLVEYTVNTTPTKNPTRPRHTIFDSLFHGESDDDDYDSGDDSVQDEGYGANDNDDDQDLPEEDGLCSALFGLSTHPETEAEAHVTRVYRLDPHRDKVKYQSTVNHFHANWTKDNATQVTVETVLEVTSNQQARFDAYKAAIADRKPGYDSERTLYHGTYSCLGKYHYDLQDDAANHAKELQQLCYKNDCATCGILAHGFDLSKSGQGSLVRGQSRVWQRFGHGIYFSPHPSKCHFYCRTGVEYNANPGYHPRTSKNFGTMVIAKVLLGVPHYPNQCTKVEEALRVPPNGCDSVVGRPGCGSLNYEEHVVYKPEAALPTAIITYSFTATTEY
ncbi:hypothetical protein BGZ81_010770 [Podila clonocystis]|nr:hypothetical protein BGZ81_010770 [Podila clonocystis]